MTTNRMNTRALVLGALIALGAAGCASGPAPATYSGTQPARSVTQEASDVTLSTRINASFAADDLVKARNIKVDVMRGAVTLHGLVHSAAERDKAISIARDTKGVTEVKSNLQVVAR